MAYVYIFINESMPGLIKVGFTTRSSELRARELYRDKDGSVTGVPTPFVVAHEWVVPDDRAEQCEKIAHAALHDTRINKDREFFRVPVDDAIRIIHSRLLQTGFLRDHFSVKELQKERDDTERLNRFLIDQLKSVNAELSALKNKTKENSPSDKSRSQIINSDFRNIGIIKNQSPTRKERVNFEWKMFRPTALYILAAFIIFVIDWMIGAIHR